MFIKLFKQLSRHDANIAGGKGASLGEMINANIPVPDGFVILSTTFDKFLEITDINVEIDAILKKVDHNKVHAVENASKQIQALILNVEMPSKIAEAIKKEFKKLNCQYVAVRSSATAEDSASAAWAGQLDSFLNTTEETLIENVQKCFASLFTPRAIFYRFEKELDKQTISVAVVVQKMVNSKISGIAFSVHPVTEERNQIIIEAGFGLGEAIVSGQITPDSYVVTKDDLKILDKNVYIQEKGIFRDNTQGGNEWQDIPEDEGQKQCLSDKQIIELSKLIIKIENHYNFPCDIEWAMEDNVFYIVQSRPITTLKNIDYPDKNKKIILNKEHSREYSLAQINSYCEIINVVKKKTGCLIENELFLYNTKNKLVLTYHQPEELKNLFIAIGSLAKKKGFVEKSIIDFKKTLVEIKPYLDKKKKVKNISEFKNLYKLFSRFYLGIGYVWVLPLLDYLPKRIRDEAMKLRQETEKYSSKRDKVLVDNLKIIFPELGELVRFLSIKEIFLNKIDNNIISDLQSRANGFIYYQDKIYQGNEFNNFFEKNNLVLADEVIDNNTKDIKGSIAQGGLARGIVKLIFTDNDLINFKKGDIIVSPMTRPEFISAMKKAVAFVTDEGGITCHAAIVAREMKKPCIIGTKIATQVLKDGDEVEVDANSGVVRILNRVNKDDVKELTKLYTRERSLFFNYLEYIGNYKLNKKVVDFALDNFIYTNTNNLSSYYYDLDYIARVYDNIIRRYQSERNYINKIITQHDIYWDKIKPYLKLEIEIKSIDELKRFCDNMWHFLTYMAVFYVSPKIEGVDDGYKDISLKYREKTQKYINNADDVFRKFIKNNFKEYFQYVDYILPEEAFVLSSRRFTNLEINNFKNRKESGYVLWRKKVYPFDKLELILKKEKFAIPIMLESPTKDEITGQVAYKGKVRGIVSIITSQEQVSSFKAGGILVSSMTMPKYLPAMKKALAFVTDEGGVTCHAAIAAREMKKPCIIGTKIATQVLKDGDEVEVDANSGVVRIIKRK